MPDPIPIRPPPTGNLAQLTELTDALLAARAQLVRAAQALETFDVMTNHTDDWRRLEEADRLVGSVLDYFGRPELRKQIESEL